MRDNEQVQNNVHEHRLHRLPLNNIMNVPAFLRNDNNYNNDFLNNINIENAVQNDNVNTDNKVFTKGLYDSTSLAVGESIKLLYEFYDLMDMSFYKVQQIFDDFKEQGKKSFFKRISGTINSASKYIDEIGEELDGFLTNIEGVSISADEKEMSYNEGEYNNEEINNGIINNLILNVSSFKKVLTKNAVFMRNSYFNAINKSWFKTTKILNVADWFINVCKEINLPFSQCSNLILNNSLVKDICGEESYDQALSTVYMTKNLLNVVSNECTSKYSIFRVCKLAKIVCNEDTFYDYMNVDFKDYEEQKLSFGNGCNIKDEAEYIYKKIVSLDIEEDDEKEIVEYIKILKNKSLNDQTSNYIANRYVNRSVQGYVLKIYDKIMNQLKNVENDDEISRFFNDTINDNNKEKYKLYYRDNAINDKRAETEDHIFYLKEELKNLINFKQTGYKNNTLSSSVYYENDFNLNKAKDENDNDNDNGLTEPIGENEDLCRKLLEKNWSVNIEKSKNKGNIGFKNATLSVGKEGTERIENLPLAVVAPKNLGENVWEKFIKKADEKNIDDMAYYRNFWNTAVGENTNIRSKNDIFKGNGKFIKNSMVNVYGRLLQSNYIFADENKLRKCEEIFADTIKEEFVVQGIYNEDPIPENNNGETYNKFKNVFDNLNSVKESGTNITNNVKSSLDESPGIIKLKKKWQQDGKIHKFGIPFIKGIGETFGEILKSFEIGLDLFAKENISEYENIDFNMDEASFYEFLFDKKVPMLLKIDVCLKLKKYGTSPDYLKINNYKTIEQIEEILNKKSQIEQERIMANYRIFWDTAERKNAKISYAKEMEPYRNFWNRAEGENIIIGEGTKISDAISNININSTLSKLNDSLLEFLKSFEDFNDLYTSNLKLGSMLAIQIVGEAKPIYGLNKELNQYIDKYFDEVKFTMYTLKSLDLLDDAVITKVNDKYGHLKNIMDLGIELVNKCCDFVKLHPDSEETNEENLKEENETELKEGDEANLKAGDKVEIGEVNKEELKKGNEIELTEGDKIELEEVNGAEQDNAKKPILAKIGGGLKKVVVKTGKVIEGATETAVKVAKAGANIAVKGTKLVVGAAIGGAKLAGKAAIGGAKLAVKGAEAAVDKTTITVEIIKTIVKIKEEYDALVK